ncbi:hypothetical protein [Candidatus Mancarchaeum acidiphilum]|nr:hypothetical protein [Candidatus Mancarchaeum acidiphilum]
MEIYVFWGVKIAFYGILIAITILIAIGTIVQYINYIDSTESINSYLNSYICHLNLGIQERLLSKSNISTIYIDNLKSIGLIDRFSVKEYQNRQFVVVECS